MAFHPHFLAVAAALVTAARDRRFVSLDLTDELEESSFRRSQENDPKDFDEGASDLDEALLGLGGSCGELLYTSVTEVEG